MSLQRYFRHHQQAEQAIALAVAMGKKAVFSTSRYFIYLDTDGWFASCAHIMVGTDTLLYGTVEDGHFIEIDTF